MSLPILFVACQARCLQWRIQGRVPGVPGVPGPPLFLDQNEARRAEKHGFFRLPLPLSQGLDDPPPSYLKILIRHWFVSLQNLVCYLNTNSLLQSLTHSLRIQPSLLSSLLLIARVREGRRETAVFAGQLSQNVWWNILGVSLVC